MALTIGALMEQSINPCALGNFVEALLLGCLLLIAKLEIQVVVTKRSLIDPIDAVRRRRMVDSCQAPWGNLRHRNSELCKRSLNNLLEKCFSVHQLRSVHLEELLQPLSKSLLHFFFIEFKPVQVVACNRYHVSLLGHLREQAFVLHTLQHNCSCRHIGGCRTAVNDLVFIMDGSWSVGFNNFETAKTWLVNVTNGFDIGPEYTQVAVIQYSDTPRLEIPFGQFLTNKELIAAIESIKYLGGNTQTGRAIKFATENVFPSSQRIKTAKNKIAVVVTDGKSQDDVVDASVEARVDKIILFAVGVGSEITESELKTIANKPSSTYVIFAEDYETIERIKEAMQQKICEESVCPTRIPVAARDEKGFELMLGFKIPQKAQEIFGSLTTEAGFLITSQTDVTENTRDIFPEGLPPSYVFVATLRLKSPTNEQKFDLWRILSKEGIIQAAVTIDGEQQAVLFTTTSLVNEIQTVAFKDGNLEKLFDEDWHQLKLLVLEMEVTCFLDDIKIQTRRLVQVIPIFINGKAQVAKHVKRETSVPIEIQKLRLYCDPQQSDRETACEIPSVTRSMRYLKVKRNIFSCKYYRSPEDRKIV
ncbi:collagen alpha-1(XXI) chain-like [Heptranchias perlo]|uniref:collagen alpha-1(XXI) chain-like n=1 Tax=Heptranchias perlo TaxID=212740 RepID=UPI00355A1693